MTKDWGKELQDATDRASKDAKSVIRKTGPKSKPFCIFSKTGKNLGCFPSRKQAEERLAQIEFFKNKGGEK